MRKNINYNKREETIKSAEEKMDDEGERATRITPKKKQERENEVRGEEEMVEINSSTIVNVRILKEKKKRKEERRKKK